MRCATPICTRQVRSDLPFCSRCWFSASTTLTRAWTRARQAHRKGDTLALTAQADIASEIANHVNALLQSEGNTPTITPHNKTNVECEACFPGWDISGEDLEALQAIDRYKRRHQRPFPTWKELLDVLRSLGWRKVG